MGQAAKMAGVLALSRELFDSGASLVVCPGYLRWRFPYVPVKARFCLGAMLAPDAIG